MKIFINTFHLLLGTFYVKFVMLEKRVFHGNIFSKFNICDTFIYVFNIGLLFIEHAKCLPCLRLQHVGNEKKFKNKSCGKI